MVPSREAGSLAVALDWKRLLGFDQAARCDDTAAAAKLGAKVGNKPPPAIKP